MSSLWTPDGEHRVERPAHQPADAPELANKMPLTDEESDRLRQAADEVAAIRAELAQAPAEFIVANHVMGLYELAAIHLGAEPANLTAARLAIDALAAVLDACVGRLGEAEATLVGARSQLQLAFVQMAGQPKGG